MCVVRLCRIAILRRVSGVYVYFVAKIEISILLPSNQYLFLLAPYFACSVRDECSIYKDVDRTISRSNDSIRHHPESAND